MPCHDTQPLLLDNHRHNFLPIPSNSQPQYSVLPATMNYFQLCELFSRIWTYSLLCLNHHPLRYPSSKCWPFLGLSLDIISYWACILALLCRGVCSFTQQIFIKYLQIVTLTGMWPWASYLTSLSLNFLIGKMEVTIPTFKNYTENYMRQSSFQTLYLSLLQTVILYPPPPSPLPIMKAYSWLGLKPL